MGKNNNADTTLIYSVKTLLLAQSLIFYSLVYYTCDFSHLQNHLLVWVVDVREVISDLFRSAVMQYYWMKGTFTL